MDLRKRKMLQLSRQKKSHIDVIFQEEITEDISTTRNLQSIEEDHHHCRQSLIAIGGRNITNKIKAKRNIRAGDDHDRGHRRKREENGQDHDHLHQDTEGTLAQDPQKSNEDKDQDQTHPTDK